MTSRLLEQPITAARSRNLGGVRGRAFILTGLLAAASLYAHSPWDAVRSMFETAHAQRTLYLHRSEEALDGTSIWFAYTWLVDQRRKAPETPSFAGDRMITLYTRFHPGSGNYEAMSWRVWPINRGAFALTEDGGLVEIVEFDWIVKVE